MFQDGDPPGPETERARLRRERAHLRRLRINEAGVALAALLVSLTALGVNFFNYRRGSEMVVLQPTEVYFYNKAAAGKGSYAVSVETAMVNASRDYGDVVVSAALRFNGGGGEEVRFPYQATVEPVVSRDAKRAAEDCPLGARCVVQTGMYVIERPRTLLDVAGGSSRTQHLSFPLEAWNCRGKEEICATFQVGAASLEALRRGPELRFAVELDFQFDGRRTLDCTISETAATGRAARAAVLDYLETKGWASAPCTEALA